MFWRRDRSTDGLQYHCKECQTPGYEAREAQRKRAAKALYARQWRAEHTERVRAYNAATQARRNAYNSAAKYRRRVARWLGETETVVTLWAEVNGATRPDPVDPRALVDHWTATGIANECFRGCGRGWREIVHAVPLYAGGAHDVTNLVPVCGRCGEA